MKGFLAAALASTQAFVSRQRNAEIASSAVTWPQAIIAMVLILALLVLTEFLPFAVAIPEFMTSLLVLLFISIVVHAVPYFVLAPCAIWTKQRDRLPLVVMLVSIGLALIQIVSVAISFAGIRSDAALVGVMAYMSGRAARTMLNFSIMGAIVVGLIVAVGIVAASILFFALPGAQALFNQ
jgi:hypothetical protein